MSVPEGTEVPVATEGTEVPVADGVVGATARSWRTRRWWVVGAAVALAGVGVAVGIAASRSADAGPDAERGPSGAVLDLFAAREAGSCEDYVATTTDFFRGDMYLGSATCADFADEAATFAERGPVRVDIRSQEQVETDTAEVQAVETYRAGTDDEYDIVMSYRVRLRAGVWKVDHVDLTVVRG